MSHVYMNREPFIGTGMGVSLGLQAATSIRLSMATSQSTVHGGREGDVEMKHTWMSHVAETEPRENLAKSVCPSHKYPRRRRGRGPRIGRRGRGVAAAGLEAVAGLDLGQNLAGGGEPPLVVGVGACGAAEGLDRTLPGA